MPLRPWQCLGVAVAIFGLSGCGPEPEKKEAPMDTACSETLKRGQCSKCRCMGKNGKCTRAVLCTACSDPYSFLANNDTNASIPHGECAIQCPVAPQRPAMPANALDLNGKEWPAACWNGTEEQHFFIIGDWGGILSGSSSMTFKNRKTIMEPIDIHAQSYVADRMAAVAKESLPKFVVNVGDNFYPGGISSPGTCNAETHATDAAGSIIFTNIFENMYKGAGLDGVEWWGILGNHDYGGYHYNVHWDQNIFYTWHSDKSRWLTPALYWTRKVQFRNFSADFFFLDTNRVDTDGNPDADPEHNICSRSHNQPPQPLDCKGTSITSPDTCWQWFMDMWNAQKKWLAEKLEASTAEWQIVVTHYPPTFEPCRSELWASYFGKYGIDLYISGHTHLQETHYKTGDFGDTAYVISGGGGGITSEIIPSKTGDDDAYGFMDVIINHDVINIIRYSHGGVDKKTIIRGQTQVFPRGRSEVQVVV